MGSKLTRTRHRLDLTRVKIEPDETLLVLKSTQTSNPLPYSEILSHLFGLKYFFVIKIVICWTGIAQSRAMWKYFISGFLSFPTFDTIRRPKKRLFLFCFAKHITRPFLIHLNCGNYRVKIRLIFSQNICFNSDFNRIFDHVHRTHCLSTKWSKYELFQL